MTETYKIAVEKEFEQDFTEEQIDVIMQQTGADTAAAGIAQIFGNKEERSIEPDQKLLSLSITADDESSNDETDELEGEDE